MLKVNMEFKPEFKEFSQTANWEYCNSILYKMCKDYPHHKVEDIEKIMAKAFIIGRTYAAAIERGGRENGLSVDEVYLNVAKGLSFLDDRLKGISGEVIDDSNVQAILQLHFNLMECIRKKSGIQLDKRSFSSKYLHFHKPEYFFIYDSVACENLDKIIKAEKIKWKTIVPKKDYNELSDKSYREFVLKCLWLRQELEKYYPKPITPRQLDNYLFLYDAELKKN